MESEILSTDPNARVMVIFGGSPVRRMEVLNLVKGLPIAITAYGVLDEEEGLQMMESLPQINLVLIGGRYTDEQRVRIKKFIAKKFPATVTTEPGWEYPYSNENIKADILKKLS